MAKEPDQLAGFETENTGGVLSGLLAEENVFDRSSLLRLGSWGGVAVVAVIAALYSSQSSVAVRREQVAAADLARQAQQLQSVARESQNEARRLASAVDTLNGDRDRLYARVTVLEQGMDSVTGAINRQPAASPSAAAPPAAASPAASPSAASPSAASPPAVAPASAAGVPAAVAEPQKEAAQSPAPAPSPVPAVAPVATTSAKSAEKPPTDKTPPEKSPSAVASTAAKIPAPPTPMPAPLVATKSIMAPPDAAASKLIEPEKPEAPAKLITSAPMPDVVASAPAADEAEPDAAETPPPKVAVQRTQFGVDLGGANSVGGLRALWRGLLKSKSNAALTSLRPIIVIREASNGLGMQLRLVAGPLDDAAAAAKICAGLSENERSCETAVYDGQRLAMTAASEPTAATDKQAADKPTTVKSSASRSNAYRRGSSRRATNPEPTKKQDSPSALSAFFSRAKEAR